MSFRNTYITDFIYQASEDTIGNNAPVAEVFQKYSRHIAHKVDERGYGYYAGTFSSLDGSIQDVGLEEIVRELEKVTKFSFRLTVLLENGPQITFEIAPTKEDN